MPFHTSPTSPHCFANSSIIMSQELGKKIKKTRAVKGSKIYNNIIIATRSLSIEYNKYKLNNVTDAEKQTNLKTLTKR